MRNLLIIVAISYAFAFPAIAQPTVPEPENLANWIRRIGENYPTEALRNEHEGYQVVKLMVTTSGRVENCEVVIGAGYETLDSHVCKQFSRYARFLPARDASDAHSSSCWSTIVRWNLGGLGAEPPEIREGKETACSSQNLGAPAEADGFQIAKRPSTPDQFGQRTQSTAPQASSVALQTRPSELDIFQASGPRVALIIGNAAYSGSMGALANPVNDAELIGSTLRRLGFQVEILTDASQSEMKRAVQRLGQRLLDAGENATGLFFYAGHGVQSRGMNYLIPVGSAIESESDLELEAVAANAILAQMEEAYVSTRIVILDACRNMPLRRRTRDGLRGLARMETPNGSFVAYSTAPGATAADGGGRHSPFAEALAAQMLVPGRPIEITFREVRRRVVEWTAGDQTPWDSSSLLDTFSFAVENQ